MRMHSDLMLLALEADYKVFDGAGAVRRLAAGHGQRQVLCVSNTMPGCRALALVRPGLPTA